MVVREVVLARGVPLEGVGRFVVMGAVPVRLEHRYQAAHGRGVVASAPASRLLRDAEDEDGGGDGGDGDGDGGGVSKPPVRPSKLTGRLVPANVNVWMGRARDGAS